MIIIHLDYKAATWGLYKSGTPTNGEDLAAW